VEKIVIKIKGELFFLFKFIKRRVVSHYVQNAVYISSHLSNDP